MTRFLSVHPPPAPTHPPEMDVLAPEGGRSWTKASPKARIGAEETRRMDVAKILVVTQQPLESAMAKCKRQRKYDRGLKWGVGGGEGGG